MLESEPLALGRERDSRATSSSKGREVSRAGIPVRIFSFIDVHGPLDMAYGSDLKDLSQRAIHSLGVDT
jgi:hypothetical protein